MDRNNIQPLRYVWFDWAVKHLLRDKANYEILEGFVSVMIRKNVKIIEILESEGNQDGPSDKFNRVDIKARNEEGEVIIIEVQNIRQMDFLKRMLYGVATAVREQAALGESYETIKKVYSISIAYFDLGEGDDYVYHGQTQLRGIHTKNPLKVKVSEIDALKNKRLVEAEAVFPEYFLVRVNEFEPKAEPGDYLSQWMDYLKTGNIRDDYDAPGLARARMQLKYDAMTPAEQKNFRDHIDDIRDQQNALHDSYYEGRAEGLAEGEVKAKKKMAASLLAAGVDIEVIAQATGFSPEEVKRMQLPD